MPETTPRLGLKKPLVGEADWGGPMRETIDTLDDLVVTSTEHEAIDHAGIPGVRGTTAVLIWNLRGALTATLGTPYYPLSNGTITRLRLNLRTEATGDVIFDLLKNGSSLFTIAPKPRVVAGTLLGPIEVPDIQDFMEGDKLEPQIIQSGNAADLVVNIEFIRND